ncbi:MAG: M14 family metallocarboxypeptidase [Deltaproteobacteria bacterium]|nr:M14 family metallocarboxypeptidase [Deltaproteobacteria bacterium]
MLHDDLVGRTLAGLTRSPWRPLALAIVALLVAILGGVTAHRLAVQTPGAPTRLAIRVSCDPASCALAESLALDVWSEERGPGLPLDVVVTDRQLPLLAAAHVRWEVLVPDIDAAAREERDRLRAPTAARPGDWFGEYRDFTAIADHLRELAALAPDRVSLQAIGASVDGRPLWALRIRGRGANPTPMLINGTQHAREWLATMATTCVADRLVRDYDRDPAIRAFVDRTDLWIVPVVNPDGYQYTWSSDRYWRKNRRGSEGVDLNRNFAVAWGGPGSSPNERAETYRGAYPFSEPESSALRDLVMREHIALHLDFHTYSQLVLYPWTHTATAAPDRARLAAIGDRIASAIFAAHQVRYALMPGAELYPAAGTMSDWVYGEAHAQSFTIELRPKGSPVRGRGGFVQPPRQIRPTCDEALAATLALGQAAR